MHNSTWVCFQCNASVREPGGNWGTYFYPELLGTIGQGCVACPECKGPARFIGDRIEIPKKNNQKGWKELEEFTRRKRTAAKRYQKYDLVRAIHEFEQRILELESRPQSQGLDVEIKKLKTQLDSLKNKADTL